MNGLADNKKLQSLYNELRRSEKNETEYESSKKRASTDLANSRKEKQNLEKRLDGVRKIIDMMEGSGGFFSVNIPEKIKRVNKSSDSAGSDFKGCIRCTGVQSADFADKFHTEKVHENRHSSNALQEFENEERRLISAIDAIDRQIKALNDRIGTLTTKIRNCNNTQSSLRRQIRNL